MIREVKGFMYCDPEDVIDNPHVFLVTDQETGRLKFNKRWGSIKHIPKRELAYIENLLNQAKEGKLSGFTTHDIVLIAFMASRIYSAVSKAYQRYFQKFHAVFYISDIVHDIITEILSLRQQGYGPEIYFSWTPTADKDKKSYTNVIEQKLISKYFDFLHRQKVFEISLAEL